MKILIIGCGYVGMALKVSLKSAGFSVSGTTRNPTKLKSLKEHFDRVYLWEKDAISSILAQHDIAIFTAAPNERTLYKETYLDNAHAIVKATHLKQIIYTSSTSIYGEHNGKEVFESTTPLPNNPLATILLQTENVYLTHPQSCIFRLGEIIGKDRNLIERLKKADGGTFPGSGNTLTNFSPLEDIISGIHFALEQNLTGIYNLCSPSLHLNRKELYDRLCKENGLKPIQWDCYSPSSHSSNKYVSSKKIEALGFKFNTYSIFS